MKLLQPNLYYTGSLLVRVHLLVEPERVTLIDTGLFGDFRRVQRAMATLGRKPGDLKAILLTHGHIDHTANAARLQEWSGAKVYAPIGDELHIAGKFPYRGAARVAGALETVARSLLRYRAPQVDVWMRDGDELPFWGGLRVVALPGHTAGHSGYYSATKRLFFVGDLFAISWRIVLPPSVFNTDNTRAKISFQKGAALDADYFVPAHYFRLGPSVARQVLRKAGH